MALAPDAAEQRLTPAVVYAAVSKKGEDQRSTEQQVAEIRARLDAIRPGAPIIGPFEDDGFSGSRGNRGPALEAAIAAAVGAASEHGAAELWAWTSSRFARGTGKIGEARAIGKLYYDLKAQGVALRTVADDEMVTNEVLIGVASTQSAKYAADLSANTRRGKAGQHRRGRPAKMSYGHKLVNTIDADGSVATEIGIDEHLAAFVRQAFELADSGRTDLEIAKALNDAGAPPKRAGRASARWTRDAVRDTLANPAYIGAIRRKQDDGSWDLRENCLPPIVDRTLWDRVQGLRSAKTAGRQAQRRGGRPANGTFVLRGLAHCGLCGAPMHLRTGLRVPTYNCSAKQHAGDCTAPPVPAHRVERRVLARIRDLVPNLDAWIAEKAAQHNKGREQFEAMVNAQRAKVRDAEVELERFRDHWKRLAGGDQDELADLALAELGRAQKELASLREDVAAAEARLADYRPADTDGAPLFFAQVRRLIIGYVDQVDDVDELAGVLRVILDRVAIHRDSDDFIHMRVVLAAPEGVLPEELDFLLEPDSHPGARGKDAADSYIAFFRPEWQADWDAATEPQTSLRSGRRRA